MVPLRIVFIFMIFAGWLKPLNGNFAEEDLSRLLRQSSDVTAFDLIIAMNTLRVSYGLPALIEDPIINAVAQSTAEIMAANQMSWHIGDVSGRLTSAGYGAGYKVWATENFAVGSKFSIDEIMLVWSDASHMIPAVNPAYCNVGAGVATSSTGMTYYVLQAAYTSGKACGPYIPPGGDSTQVVNTTAVGGGGISQLIIPVKIATPDAQGNIYHVVEAGQSYWSIAVAYKITIRDLEIWNNVSRDAKLPVGKRLFIPGSNTKGYTTPTPVGMIQIALPDKDGKVIHTVASYQTLSTISQAYSVDIGIILTLNGIQEDWPLQIGQNLIIKPGLVTPSPTPRPLTPLEKLTPASDGKYYHEILSGETLSWVAELYGISIFDLFAWNGLNGSSVVYPGQKILLQVTPPPTATYTPAPATVTSTSTSIISAGIHTTVNTEVVKATIGDVEIEPTQSSAQSVSFWLIPVGLIVTGMALIAILFWRKKS